VLAGCTLALAVVSAGTWLTVAHLTGASGTDVTAAAPVSGWTPQSLWGQGLDVIRLKERLVRAGYSIKVDGTLDPVAKSARLDFTHVGNPAAWNLRFGLYLLDQVRRASPHRPRWPTRRQREHSSAARGDPERSTSQGCGVNVRPRRTFNSREKD
jgi:hypothetical protein